MAERSDPIIPVSPAPVDIPDHANRRRNPLSIPAWSLARLRRCSSRAQPRHWPSLRRLCCREERRSPAPFAVRARPPPSNACERAARLCRCMAPRQAPAAIGGSLPTAAANGRSAAEYEIAHPPRAMPNGVVGVACGLGVPKNLGEAAIGSTAPPKQGLAPAQFRVSAEFDRRARGE